MRAGKDKDKMRNRDVQMHWHRLPLVPFAAGLGALFLGAIDLCFCEPTAETVAGRAFERLCATIQGAVTGAIGGTEIILISPTNE